jgi:hypothetical protein
MMKQEGMIAGHSLTAVKPGCSIPLIHHPHERSLYQARIVILFVSNSVTIVGPEMLPVPGHDNPRFRL